MTESKLPVFPAALALIWFVIVAMWLTWTPFDPALEPNPVRLLPHTNPWELLGNLVLLAPVGMSVALLSRRRPLLTAWTATVLLGISLEAGQVFAAGRVVSVVDVLLNSGGATLAAAVALRLCRWFGASRVVGATAAVILTGVLAQAGYAGQVFRRGIRLQGWDPSYDIALADEIGADRRYQGHVWEGMICAGPKEGPVCAGPGADLSLRQRLVEAAEQSQRFEIFARFLSESSVQAGPTRIITFSDGAYERNLTLGQDSASLVIRIRTPLMGPNGRDYELLIRDAIPDSTPVSVHAIFADATIRTEVAANGTRRISTHAFDALSSLILLRGIGGVTPTQIVSSRLLGAFVLVLPGLLVSVTLGRMWRDRRRPSPESTGAVRTAGMPTI